MIIHAHVFTVDGYFVVAMHTYPALILSDPMCKLSVDGKAFTVPTGDNPDSPWIWKFAMRFEPAISQLLTKHECHIRFADTYEQTRLGRLFP